MSMGAFAEWWRGRIARSFEIHLEGEKLKVMTTAAAEDSLWLCVHFPGGIPTLYTLEKGFLAASNARRLLPEQRWSTADPAKLQKRTAQMLVHDLTWHYSRFKQRWGD
jgi:hypothetical protein